MRFGPVSLDEARGAILAHSHRVGGQMLRKGALLDADGIAVLRDSGLTEIIAARLDPGDVPEDTAADRLADALLAPLIGRTRAATGRVNLRAETPGLLAVNAAKIDRLNAVDESLTIGTLPDGAVVAARDMLATIKVIPFAVPGPVLAVAEALAQQGPPAFTLHKFRPLVAGLIVTELAGLKPSVIEGTIEATRARVEGLGGTLLPARHCAHATQPIAAALAALIEDGAGLLLIAGASAVVDRRDVGPAGIVAAGGEIVHFGMPVDPGNLICVGRIGQHPALVLPGCARSPALNGIDRVLGRLFAGLPVAASDIARMGVGGLLKDIDSRPVPRARADAATRVGQAPRTRDTVAAIVLAAGRSRRMAPHNKLLVADGSGRPMIARVVDQVVHSLARPVLVVTGHQSDAVERALLGRAVQFVHAPDYGDGLSASLKAGIAAVPPDASAALVCLGDMPLVQSRMIDRLIAAYDPDEGRSIVLPTFNGKQGNPMLWDRRFFPEILALSGDSGARALLAAHMEDVAEVEIGDAAVLLDFDTPESLAGLG